MPELRLYRRIPGATEVTTWRMAGAPSNYWLSKKIRARFEDENQDPWTVFEIRENQSTALRVSNA